MKQALALITLLCLTSCLEEQKSASGVGRAKAEVQLQANGLTVEQENIQKRLQMENLPGSVKHLYLLSAYSGEVVLYSTVKGKITSSGKRLTPLTVGVGEGGYGLPFRLNDSVEGLQKTGEVIQDDGTYGSSIEYLYWWDQSGVYHQQYVTGGLILHIADQPMQFGRVTIQTANGK